MALIKIHADGTFETAHVEAVAASSNVKEKLTEAKAKLATITKDHKNAEKIDALRATRERVQNEFKAKGKTGPRTAVAHTQRVAKINGVIKTLTSQMSGGKYVKVAVLQARAKKARDAVLKYHTLLGGLKKPTTAKPATRRVTDPAAKFARESKKIAGTVSRGIRSELRDHGKTALVPVSNRPGAKAPVAKPSSKKADIATKHATKPARGAIGNTLAEIKATKARIATGELKGAKLIRAQEELAKQREALKGLRAGKTPANQRTIVKTKPAKHMGGAKKIVGKPSGMGDASKKPRTGAVKATIPSLTEKLKRLRTTVKETNNAGRKKSLNDLIARTKAALAALKAKAK